MKKPLVQAFSEQSRYAFLKRGISHFRRFLNENKGVENWLLASDYNLGDRNRPTDVIAFTIMPVRSSVEAAVRPMGEIFHADFKNLKRVSPQAKGFFYRKGQAFSFCWLIEKTSSLLWQEDQNRLNVARQSISETLTLLNGHGAPDWFLSRMRALEERSRSNNFSAISYDRVLLLSACYSLLVRLLHEERKSTKKIFWCSDRDPMTEWADGALYAIAFVNTVRMATWAGKSLDTQDLPVLIIDSKPDCWFDFAIRPPDYLAAALSAWDLDKNSTGQEKQKYSDVLRDIIADNPRVFCLKASIKEYLEIKEIRPQKLKEQENHI